MGIHQIIFIGGIVFAIAGIRLCAFSTGCFIISRDLILFLTAGLVFMLLYVCKNT